jgi:DNA repair photolyase
MQNKTLDFHMTTTCNHACIFCSEDDRMKLYAKHPLTELQIKTILVDRAKK